MQILLLILVANLVIINIAQLIEQEEEVTTKDPDEVAFRCMIGSIDSVHTCKPGTGSDRFKIQNIIKRDCLDPTNFGNLRTLTVNKGRRNRNDKIYACASHFKWITIDPTKLDEEKDEDYEDEDELDGYTDPENPNKTTTAKTLKTEFTEEHFCLDGTLESIKEVTKSKDECYKVTYPNNKNIIHEKICTCTLGGGCNDKFESGFKKLPRAAASLCGTKTLSIPKPKGKGKGNPDEADSSTKIGHMNILAFIMMQYISFLFYYYLST